MNPQLQALSDDNYLHRQSIANFMREAYVNEDGEVLIYHDIYLCSLNFLAVEGKGEVVKVLNIPPVRQAGILRDDPFTRVHKLVILTQDHKVMIFTQDRPEGVILFLTHVKELSINGSDFFIVDRRNNLVKLKINDDFSPDADGIMEVKAFRCSYFSEIISMITRDDKLAIMDEDELLPSEVAFNSKIEFFRNHLIVTEDGVVHLTMIGGGRPHTREVITLDHKLKDICYYMLHIYTIDMSGRLRLYSLDVNDEVKSVHELGNGYERFIDGNCPCIEDYQGRLVNLISLTFVGFPSKLMNLEVHDQIARRSRTTKSSRNHRKE